MLKKKEDIIEWILTTEVSTSSLEALLQEQKPWYGQTQSGNALTHFGVPRDTGGNNYS